ncbi:MAG TPA: 1,6-anhydro-N-acetylmuramyl-L-alanine amidase AmpD [Accumulibacter sp.]|nr:1,6-anhydro-N-acetylmuramyl-L-alanine amidase AmpD [Accumulibacter sp.]HMX22081.1 1,6-anhydro-N-acetylmuramyl-L-alanine amidase AmpD [Accumulibacter sp.]HMY06159.1 1,6-anhydro-N-acetylmuramyl-L-alanine amidase AmpD [Accumulibacter sp.]HNC16575.1 1,6-anhydro-N-acetylmuramyl-L-alanine amidase AmpD [Accumulibacter sp.]HND79213.1 1,6-anhydro-N-acetylmuramyl-L-alanine amidase AmpD [Accumulibacter sp.]
MTAEPPLLTLRDGWLAGIRRIDSPNHDSRPDNEAVTLIVIHAISLPPAEFGGPAIIEFFTNGLESKAHPYFAQLEGVRVSAHFLLRRNGEMIQFVSCEQRAWHAGQSCWQGRTRCNDFSVGIELEGCDDRPFEDAQYRQLLALLRVLRANYPITAVVGHSDIAPGRKTDPGPCFDWQRLAAAGKFPGQCT